MLAIRIIAITGAVITPAKAKIEPINFLHLFPTNKAVVTAIIQGRDRLSAKYSVNSSSVIQFFFSTSSDFRIGKITYPPPKSIAPILKNSK